MSGDSTEHGARGTVRRGAAFAVAGAAAFGVGMGLAQDGASERAPNPALTLSVGLGLQVDDDDTKLRTDLGLNYLAQTRTQSFSFNLGTAVELGEDGLDDNAFLPSARLAYGFDNGVSQLTLSGSYRLQNVDGISFVLDDDANDFDELDTIEDDGQLETVRASLGLALWRNEPVGLELGADVTRRSYRNTNDPSLDDSRRAAFDVALRLSPRRGLDFRLTAARTRDEDDGTLKSETETTQLGARVTWAVTPGTTVDLSLAHSEREETRNAFGIANGALVLTGGRETVTNDGLIWNGSITRARPNGSQSLSFSRQLTDDGAISTLQVGRALELANGGQLELGLGVSHFEDGDTVPTVSLSYDKELAQGAALQASVTRTAGTDGDDQDVARTRAQIAYQRPLSPISQLGLSAGLARIDVIDGFEEDQSAVSLGASYTRQLSEDWALSARYDHTTSRQKGSETTRNNRFSLSVGREFTFRP